MTFSIKKYIHLKPQSAAEMADIYRSLQVNYPKFFKMDNLSKLGFLASEMIFKNEENETHFAGTDFAIAGLQPVPESIVQEPREDLAIICFNRSSSLEIDTQYQNTIADNENYFPSPSLFVYTLPNIVMGEIAIRNKVMGETSFYVCENFDEKQIFRTVKNSFSDKNTNFVLVSWIESFENTHEILMLLVEKNGKAGINFDEKELNLLYNHLNINVL
jgi:3-oxoacyl-[acyl-carrier-protein] synthase-1